MHCARTAGRACPEALQASGAAHRTYGWKMVGAALVAAAASHCSHPSLASRPPLGALESYVRRMRSSRRLCTLSLFSTLVVTTKTLGLRSCCRIGLSPRYFLRISSKGAESV